MTSSQHSCPISVAVTTTAQRSCPERRKITLTAAGFCHCLGTGAQQHREEKVHSQLLVPKHDPQLPAHPKPSFHGTTQTNNSFHVRQLPNRAEQGGTGQDVLYLFPLS